MKKSDRDEIIRAATYVYLIYTGASFTTNGISGYIGLLFASIICLVLLIKDAHKNDEIEKLEARVLQ